MTEIEIEREWTQDFHGYSYNVNVIVNGRLLRIELEDCESSHRWSGDFTRQWLEDTWQMSGNFKSFPVYIKMLIAAFDKENDNLTVNILSYTELTLLKAKRLGEQGAADTLTGSSLRRSSTGEQRNTRYCIMSYNTEFKQELYPLTLEFETSPNVEALQRAVRRLRRQLGDKDSHPSHFDGDKESDLRQLVAQLRQDNQELRHRLRQAEPRVGKWNKPGSSSPTKGSSTANIALASANTQLQRRIESLTAELSQLSVTHQKLKVAHAAEITKWKLKLGQTAGSGLDSGTQCSGCADHAVIVSELKRRLIQSERECRSLRLMHGKPTETNGAVLRAGYSPVGRSRSATPSRDRPYTTGGGGGSNRSYRASPASSPASSPADGGRYSRYVSPSSSTGRGSRHASPSMRSAHGPQSSPHTTRVSSSLFGRFDPTAYQQEKARRQREALESPHRAWRGAGVRPAISSDADAGYESSHSQASRGSSRGRASPSPASGRHQQRAGSRNDGYFSDTSQRSGCSRMSDGGGRPSRKARKKKSSLPSARQMRRSSPGQSDSVLNSLERSRNYSEEQPLQNPRQFMGSVASRLPAPPLPLDVHLMYDSRESAVSSTGSARPSEGLIAVLSNGLDAVSRAEEVVRHSRETERSISELRNRLMRDDRADKLSFPRPQAAMVEHQKENRSGDANS